MRSGPWVLSVLFVHLAQCDAGHSLKKNIALTSAVGGMGLSLIGMAAASLGLISPIQGAIAQAMIGLLYILNSLRMILPTGSLSDFQVPVALPRQNIRVSPAEIHSSS